MRPSALASAIVADRAAGYTPAAVIASAGTVNTGAIDPLEDIADICRERDVWLHVDGACGAPAILSAKYAARLAALRRADSIALDPHKWLCVPVEAGLVLIRHADTQRATFSLVPADRRGTHDEVNLLNKALLERLQLGGTAFLSSTVMDGVFWLRACVLNPRTTRTDTSNSAV